MKRGPHMSIIKDIVEILVVGIGALVLTALIVAPFIWLVWALAA